ncbi:MAG: CDP-diacylglycerol--glycerol-3-phosphate 3-phosphatidyltransferase [Omnitrophica WOR_2 bacterium RIFCSPLOWO2_12_FULL_50_9]|nr:MAG: CDP-diacylglycerol--glycerol-3-phosphate 3-phosphatidyltransferase [Omnitrophica WOR_2 bacterium RIFCSPHIGHO2_02_FULL_50_17]OGX43406.1 MAG: CDP-diacylglycerol--glycerol-3-phosphate 3-phosphatidyltransferase [Omnitrophica WOR_2 bacterium RIFCSPLOWO2_12_FULL_50_9]
MNLPNRLTISRILLTFVFVFCVFQTGALSKIAAVLIFFIASLTDFYDGYYAKRHNLVTDFGKLMDPIADKFLILSAFFIFMSRHLIGGWMFAVICGREVVITFIRLYAMRHGSILPAEKAGKIKTVMQITAVLLILFFMFLLESMAQFHWPKAFMAQLYTGIYLFMFAVVMVTLLSGISFLWNNRRFTHGG